MPSPRSVVIVDDHPVFCDGLKGIIENTPSWQVIAIAHDGDTAIDYYQTHQPDIIVLDIHMAGMSGLAAAESILQHNPNANCIMLTMYREAAYCQRALALGVKGYLLKEDAAEDILACFDQVLKNQIYISRRVEDVSAHTPPIMPVLPENLLTERELALLSAIADFKVNKVIAREMNISLNTVHNHRQNICHKLELTGRQALLQYAVNWKRGVICN